MLADLKKHAACDCSSYEIYFFSENLCIGSQMLSQCNVVFLMPQGKEITVQTFPSVSRGKQKETVD